MAGKPNVKKIAERLEGSARRAFLESVANVKSDLQIRMIEEAIRKDDIGRLLSILRMDSSYFEPLDRAMAAAYQQAGDDMLALWKRQARQKGVQVRGAFSTRNEQAEAFLRNQSSRMIVDIQEGTREAVQLLLEDNLRRGTAPRTTALDLVGRLNKVTRKREGGIIGLHRRGLRMVQNAQAELAADPATAEGRARLRNYLKRELRDKRFDGSIKKALRQRTRVPTETATRAKTGLESKALRRRGEDIARTEMLQSTHTAQEHGLDQMVQRGDVSDQNITGTWDPSLDSATRSSHREMDGQVRKKGEPFETGNGYLMMHPLDPSLGAPAEEIINCRCVKKISIDWIQQAADDQAREL